MKPKNKRRILTTIRFILGIIFLVSGIGKLISGSEAQYLVELLATEFYWLIEYSSFIVITTSIIELVIAVFLLWGRYLKWALSAMLLMLIGFSSVLFHFYLQGMNVEGCGCFGAFGFSSGLEFTLIRNVVMMLLVIVAFVLTNSDNG
ncbi:MauE/DoxX family redox-associated membrane protein [Fodinibius salsisoli]|uniref:DoxX family membrane protein n=1 Tax=Fodinibius salsisoli TaxID=2820877 RepID=A0ABT3PRU7_9BACT|nr:MauE/DoxX family redox-associated membrane protein [Fodinibius salsisoli]MCW9708589.1 DoxX family membrane protein [Fodinibius salsisoli]